MLMFLWQNIQSDEKYFRNKKVITFSIEFDDILESKMSKNFHENLFDLIYAIMHLFNVALIIH